MQKIINVIAVSSGIVSLAIVVGGVSVYVSRDAIIDGIKSQVMESVAGSIPGIGALGGTLGGTESLPLGSNELSPPLSPTSGLGLPAPGNPF